MSDESRDREERWLEEFRPFPEEHRLYGDAARRTGLETAHWARQVLNRAAHSLLRDLPDEQPGDQGIERALAREMARREHELKEALARVRANEELQRFLADATALLAESLELGETLWRVARLSVPVFADWCLLDLLDGRQLQRAAVAHDDPADAALAARVRDYRADLDTNLRYPASRVLKGEGPVLIEAFDGAAARAAAHDDEHLALIEAIGVRSVICVALVAHGRTLGFLTFMTTRSGRAYAEADVVVAQDIARRCALAIENARLLEEARSALRMRDDFLWVASHELRTPLTPLQLQLEAIERRASELVKTGKEAWLGDRLTSIRRQTERLEHLVEELLEMSHIVEGRVRVRPERVDLAGLVDRVVSRFRERNPGEEIAVEVAPGLIGCWDRERLGQVLANLLANAHRHGAGQPILLRATRDGEAALLAVSDRRAGGAPRDHRRASALGQEPGRNYGGLGVGLFVTRQILDAMGASIEASSTPQAGVTFTVRLPFEPPVPPGLDEPTTSASTVH